MTSSWCYLLVRDKKLWCYISLKSRQDVINVFQIFYLERCRKIYIFFWFLYTLYWTLMQIRNMNSRVIKEIFWHTYCVWFYVNISVSRYQPSAIIRIKWYNVVWDPNRAQKLQLQLFFSCWLIQTKIDLTPEILC